MTVDLQAAAPTVAIQVFVGNTDVTADAVFSIISPAFHLPGQGTISMLHGPLALP